MNRFVYMPTVVTTLLVVVVGCTSISPAPTPTSGVRTPTQTVMVPGTETPSITTATQTLTATAAINNTSEPTFTLSPTATVCATPSGGVTYVVQAGDTLNQIALRYNMSAEQLQLANCLASADTIFAGQTIYVPFYIPPILIQPTPVQPPPAETVIPPNLKQAISFDPGGGNVVPVCPDPVPDRPMQITVSSRIRDLYELCVYGFSMDEQVTVQLSGPGKISFESTLTVDAANTARTYLWMPAGMPLGMWSASARRGQTSVESQIFSVESFGEPAINTEPVGAINPFEPHRCDTYPRGSSLMIRGTNFGSIQSVPIGLYLWTRNIRKDETGRFVLPLVSSQVVPVSNGEFSLPVSITTTAAAGTYWVVSVIDPKDLEKGSKEHPYSAGDLSVACYKVPS